MTFEKLNDDEKLAYIDAEICRLKNIRQLINQKRSDLPAFLALDREALDAEIAKCCNTPINPAAIVAALKQEKDE